MLTNGFKWIDSDMHLAEPGNLWDEYIDPSYRNVYPRWTRTDASYNSLLVSPGAAPVAIGGHRGSGAAAEATIQQHTVGAADIKERHYHDYKPYVDASGAVIPPQNQLRAMDREGIDVAVLFPTVGQRGWREAPNDVALALCRAYNRWLADFCGTDPARLKVNALVPIGDIDAAIAELRHAVRDLGAVGVSPGCSRPEVRLDDPRYEPFWAEAEALGIALTFHGSAQLHLQHRYGDHPIFGHATGRSTEHPLAFMELLFGGVLERHPNLRCAFLEAGCSWTLYWLFRFEEEWERFRDSEPTARENVRMAPLEYWKRQCFSGVECEEWPLRGVVEILGEDNWVLSSDFPHFDSAFPHASKKFMALRGVSDAAKGKILWDNCARLYGL